MTSLPCVCRLASPTSLASASIIVQLFCSMCVWKVWSLQGPAFSAIPQWQARWSTAACHSAFLSSTVLQPSHQQATCRHQQWLNMEVQVISHPSTRNDSASAAQMQQSGAEAAAALHAANSRVSAAADENAELTEKLQEATDACAQLNHDLSTLQVGLVHSLSSGCSALVLGRKSCFTSAHAQSLPSADIMLVWQI